VGRGRVADRIKAPVDADDGAARTYEPYRLEALPASDACQGLMQTFLEQHPVGQTGQLHFTKYLERLLLSVHSGTGLEGCYAARGWTEVGRWPGCVRVAPGDHVSDGQVVAIIEAMKIMNEITAPRSGRVAGVAVRVGETVESGAPILTFAAEP